MLKKSLLIITLILLLLPLKVVTAIPVQVAVNIDNQSIQLKAQNSTMNLNCGGDQAVFFTFEKPYTPSIYDCEPIRCKTENITCEFDTSKRIEANCVNVKENGTISNLNQKIDDLEYEMNKQTLTIQSCRSNVTNWQDKYNLLFEESEKTSEHNTYLIWCIIILLVLLMLAALKGDVIAFIGRKGTNFNRNKIEVKSKSKKNDGYIDPRVR